MDRKKILVFIDWYLPGYKAGGPIKSVSNIISALKKEFEFYVFTRNNDLGDSNPYENIISDKWTVLSENYQVYYASQKSISVQNIYKIISQTEFDILYLNGIFSFRFNILPLLILKLQKKKSKIIVSPRGMFGEGALGLKKTKKKLFISFALIFGLFRKVTWHSSTPSEEKEIRKIFGNKAQVINALNISIPPQTDFAPKVKQKGNAKFFFLSRISRKKNLSFALEILKNVSEGEISFDVYGPVEDPGYWKECKSIIKSLNGNIKVNYRGMLDPNFNRKILSNYHFMFFPTLNENYGHVIFESLSAGCPVILSDQTPWKNLEKNKIGWEIPLDKKEIFINVIKKCILMEEFEFNDLSAHSFEFAMASANQKEVIEQNRKLFS